MILMLASVNVVSGCGYFLVARSSILFSSLIRQRKARRDATRFAAVLQSYDCKKLLVLYLDPYPRRGVLRVEPPPRRKQGGQWVAQGTYLIVASMI